jgi:hypothetical protein
MLSSAFQKGQYMTGGSHRPIPNPYVESVPQEDSATSSLRESLSKEELRSVETGSRGREN